LVKVILRRDRGLTLLLEGRGQELTQKSQLSWRWLGDELRLLWRIMQELIVFATGGSYFKLDEVFRVLTTLSLLIGKKPIGVDLLLDQFLALAV
jgi:hypothetical protein